MVGLVPLGPPWTAQKSDDLDEIACSVRRIFVPKEMRTGVHARFRLQPVLGPAFMPGKPKPPISVVLID
jgi:hypothetical protein